MIVEEEEEGRKQGGRRGRGKVSVWGKEVGRHGKLSNPAVPQESLFFSTTQSVYDICTFVVVTRMKISDEAGERQD